MPISLQKGQKISLTKEAPGLSSIMVGLGWDEVKQERKKLFKHAAMDIDCDASAFLLVNGKLLSAKDLVYFCNLTHKSNSVKHMGDNLTGAGDGDDEQIFVDLTKVPEKYTSIVFAVNIYKADDRKQDFSMVQNAFIRLVNEKTGREIIRYDLGNDFSKATAVIFGELYRRNGEWKFNAIGNGCIEKSISTLANRYR